MNTTNVSNEKFWNNPKFRSLFYQVAILSVVISGAWWLFATTTHNLETRGINSGFDFLKRAAGFDIDFTLIEHSSQHSNSNVFFVGLYNTLLISVLGIICATIIGVMVGVARLSKNWIIAKIALVYIELFRNIPLLLQIFFWYFAVLGSLPHIRQAMKNGWFNDSVFFSSRGFTVPKPLWEEGSMWVLIALIAAIIIAVVYRKMAIAKLYKTGQSSPIFSVMVAIIIGLPIVVFLMLGAPLSFEFPQPGKFNLKGGVTLIPEFMALLFALSIYTGAFIAEIVRAGITSVSHGQTEAAHSLGIKQGLTLRLVIIPQALRVIIPPLASQYLNLAKNSSLAAAIAYPELVSVFTGTVLNNSGQALECVAITMVAYLTISLSIAAFMNWYNKRIALVER